jgi:NhaP-type Na+/H+ or K+/H+ antiporter
MPEPPLAPLLQILLLGAAGIGAQWLAWRVRVPSILPLLALGLAVGPGLGWTDPGALLGPLLPPLVSLAVAVVLFEGGLTLDVRELKGDGAPVVRLVTLGVLLTWGLVYALARLVLGLSPPLSLVLGALLTVTGPTVVSPLLNHVRPTGTVGPLLKWEGIVADVIGATLAVLTLGTLAAGTGTGALVGGLAATLGVGLAVGAGVAWALVLLIERHALPDRLEAQVTLALVLSTFAAGDAVVHEGGLVAVTVMGFVLANQRRVRVAPILHFKELLATLLLGALFVTLAASIQREALAALDARTGVFVLALVFIARPLAAFGSLAGSTTTWQERTFVAGLAPRGVVAVSVAALFSERLVGLVPDAERLVPTVFAVVLGTVLVYGLGSAPLARALGLAHRQAEGLLLVGASRFAQGLASALSERGVPCVLVDSSPGRLVAPRLAGLRTVRADATAPHVATHIPMGGLGRTLALTPNPEVNRLAVQQFEEFFGRSEVYRLADGREDVSLGAGRTLFTASATAEDLEDRMARGETVRATRLTEAFDLGAWREHQGPGALPLARRTPSGRIELFTAAARAAAQDGDELFYLAPPDGA